MSEQIPQAWLSRVRGPARAELESLAQESDPELRDGALLSFAVRQETGEYPALAAEIYAELAAQSSFQTFRERAQGRLDLFAGRGSTGARAEFLLRGFTQQAADPVMIGSMFGAGMLFRLTRLSTLSRLAAHPTANLLTRGFGARAVAGMAGFAVEAPAFTMLGRLGNTALGRPQDWSAPAISRDLASSFLVLGGMKLAGWGSGSAYRRFAGRLGERGAAPLQAWFQQVGMLSGLLAGHSLEERFGLRPHQPGAATLIDSLAMLLQFHVAGRLGGAVLGPGFQAWERRLDLQGEWLSRPPLLRPHEIRSTAFATPNGADFLLPSSVMMSSNEFDPKLKTMGSVGSPRADQSPEVGPPGPRVDPRQVLRVPRLLRTVQSNDLGEGRPTWSYELVLDRLEDFFQTNSDRAIAVRDGQEIGLRLIHAGLTNEFNDFMRPGVPCYSFEIREGDRLGELTLFIEPNTLHIFSIRTRDDGPNGPQMLPGVGTVVMDWLATQAAWRGQGLTVLGIQNPRIFRILENRGLIDPNFSLVQAARFRKPHGSRVVAMAKLGDRDFLVRNAGRGFFNVQGVPHPELLPPYLRSGIAVREGSHPYELQIDPLRNFLSLDQEAVIARRDGGELRARVVRSGLADSYDRFMPTGTPYLEFELQEAGQTGQMQMYLEPGRLTLSSLDTQKGNFHMLPGAGTIALDWLHTQAALHGMEVSLLNVKNPRIVRILSRNNLLLPESGRVEKGVWDLIYGAFDSEGPLPYSETDMLEWFQSRVVSMPRVLQIQGRPNPELIPPKLRPTPQDHP